MVLQARFPIPLSDPIAKPKRPQFRGKDPQEGLVTDKWVDYLTQVVDTLFAAPLRQKVIVLTNQGASIGATSVGALSGGIFRVSYYTRITQPASTSSGLTVTIGWTESGVPLSLAGAAIIGNLVTSVQTNTYLIRADPASATTFATTYGSTGATPMLYRLEVTVEQIL